MSRLVRLYPRAWRDRYGEEFQHLLDERPPGLRDRLDIIRGAVDAQLHPRALVDGPEPAPWTHRLPGLLALLAGLATSAAVTSVAFGTGPDWGSAGDVFGVAFMLMLISVPGDYLAPFGGRIAIAIGVIVVCIAASFVTDWWWPAVAIAMTAELVAAGGLLAMAAFRAGVGPDRRWLLIATSVAFPGLAVGAHTLLQAATGIALVPDGSRLAALLFLPYGLAWLVVGVRLALRGSATFTDLPIEPTPAREVQTA